MKEDRIKTRIKIKEDENIVIELKRYFNEK